MVACLSLVFCLCFYDETQVQLILLQKKRRQMWRQGIWCERILIDFKAVPEETLSFTICLFFSNYNSELPRNNKASLFCSTSSLAGFYHPNLVFTFLIVFSERDVEVQTVK